MDFFQALHFSVGFAPQMLHVPPSSLNNGLLLLHVPANLPSFFTRTLMAIPAKASPTRTTEANTRPIFKYKNLIRAFSDSGT